MESPTTSQGRSPSPLSHPPSPHTPGTPGTDTDVLFEDSLDFSTPEQHVLVTGGLGFIGSHTSLELLKAGHNIIIVDDLSNSFRHVFDRILLVAKCHFDTHGGQCPRAKLYNIDYQDKPAMRALLAGYDSTDMFGRTRSSVSGVIHFAAFKAVGESISSPLKYYGNNICGLISFLVLLEQYDIKTIIFSSSATVYGKLADKGLPLREEHCVHEKERYQITNGTERDAEQGCTGLINPYGRTKFFGEAILADVAASDPSWTIIALRYFNPIGCDASGLLGEDPKGIPSNLVPVVVKVMTGQWKELSIYGADWDTPDGTAIRDFIHVTDLARGHIAALDAAQRRPSQKNFRTYNLGTGFGHSVLEIVETMESVIQRSIPKRVVERRAGDVGSCVALASRARTELGWAAEKSLRDACLDICNSLAMAT